jgi:hypothetical protein
MARVDRSATIDERPQCARCRRPVDGVTLHADPASGTFTLTAHCHGARENVDVSRSELMRIGACGGYAVSFGIAFQRAAASPAARRHAGCR